MDHFVDAEQEQVWTFWAPAIDVESSGASRLLHAPEAEFVGQWSCR